MSYRSNCAFNESAPVGRWMGALLILVMDGTTKFISNGRDS